MSEDAVTTEGIPAPVEDAAPTATPAWLINWREGLTGVEVDLIDRAVRVARVAELCGTFDRFMRALYPGREGFYDTAGYNCNGVDITGTPKGDRRSQDCGCRECNGYDPKIYGDEAASTAWYAT